MSNVVQGIDLDDLLGADFAGMSPSGGGQYIEPGEYVFKVVSCELKKGFKGITFIGTNEVVQVIRSNEQGLTPGTQRNVVETLSGANGKICQANMKGYLMACCESLYQRKINQTAVDPKFVGAACAANQPLKGVYVGCSAFHKPTKSGKGSGIVTIKNWRMLSNAELAGLGVQQPTPAG